MKGGALRSAKRQAGLEATVSYGPQEGALAQLLRDAEATYHMTLKQAGGTRRGISSALRSSRPRIRTIYNQADKSRVASNALVDTHLAPLRNAGIDPYRAVIAAEEGGAKTRLATERASTMTDIERQLSEARSGEAYARQNALSQFTSSKARIGQSLLDLERQKGAFQSASINDILTAIRKEQTTRRGQNLTLKAARARVAATRRGQDLAHQDRQAAANKKGKGSGGRHLTGDQVQKRLDAINYARGWFSRLEGHFSRHQIYEFLRTGQSVKDPSGNRLSIKATGNDWINAGADLHYLGSLSGTNLHRLRKIGLKGHIPSSWKGSRSSRAGTVVGNAIGGLKL